MESAYGKFRKTGPCEATIDSSNKNQFSLLQRNRIFLFCKSISRKSKCPVELNPSSQFSFDFSQILKPDIYFPQRLVKI